MQFIDETKINIRSGAGGDGCLSFRREANIPKGGPDGGNGGDGGAVIAVAIAGLNTLIDFRYRQHFKANKGETGKGRNCHGKSADDLYIKVPVGTQIFAEGSNLLIADLIEVGQEVVLANGGKGGLGNVNFKSSVNQAPRKITKGEEFEEMDVWLKLKLISNVGLVGLPNAGKSTFLSVVSRAKPKIADYPFTTLKPQLGVAYIDEDEIVIADIPGLIEGAHSGTGLGIRFLKHVERCQTILHLVDITDENFIENYKIIRNELKLYSEELHNKQEVIALSKTDAFEEDIIKEKLQEFNKATQKQALPLSSLSRNGLENILRKLNFNVKNDQAVVEGSLC